LPEASHRRDHAPLRWTCVVAAGVLALAGCGSSRTNASTQPTATQGVTTVTALTATTHPAMSEPAPTSVAAPATIRSSAATTAAIVTSAPSASSVAATAVSIDNFAFAPATVAVKTGATVTWTNNDGEPHTVAFDDGQARSPVLSAPSATFSHTFTHAGTFTYHCSIHAYMSGTVTVSDA
jgi:plastocyanin